MAIFVNISGIIGFFHVGFTEQEFFVNFSGMLFALLHLFKAIMSLMRVFPRFRT